MSLIRANIGSTTIRVVDFVRGLMIGSMKTEETESKESSVLDRGNRMTKWLCCFVGWDFVVVEPFTWPRLSIYRPWNIELFSFFFWNVFFSSVFWTNRTIPFSLAYIPFILLYFKFASWGFIQGSIIPRLPCLHEFVEYGILGLAYKRAWTKIWGIKR